MRASCVGAVGAAGAARGGGRPRRPGAGGEGCPRLAPPSSAGRALGSGGEGPARERGGRSSRGDRAPSSSSAHSSLSSSCNFSSALRFNLSKPELVATDAGGGPGFLPAALCGNPAHPAAEARWTRGAPGWSALSPKRTALPPACRSAPPSSQTRSHLPGPDAGRQHLHGGGRPSGIGGLGAADRRPTPTPTPRQHFP